MAAEAYPPSHEEQEAVAAEKLRLQTINPSAEDQREHFLGLLLPIPPDEMI